MLSWLIDDLLWLAGMGFSFAVACGSLCVLGYIRDKDRYTFRNEIVVSSKGNQGCGWSPTPTTTEYDSQPLVTVHKIVPNFVLMKSSWAQFQKIHKQCNVMIFSKSFKYRPDSELNTDPMGEQQIRLAPATNNEFKYLTIEGYKQCVMQASDLVDKLLDLSNANLFQVFQVRTSQVGCLIGPKGATINSIQKGTGAEVKIVQPPGHRRPLTTIHISGKSMDQIRKAFSVIESQLSKDRRPVNKNAGIKFIDEEDEQEEDVCAHGRQPHRSGHGKLLTETLPDSNSGPFPDVYVSYVVSPFEFYLHLVSKCPLLDDLHSRMDLFYQLDSNRVPHRQQDTANRFVAVFQKETSAEGHLEEEDDCLHFYRAVVLELVKPDTDGPNSVSPGCRKQPQYKVFYLDIGQTELHDLDQVFRLADSFLNELPFQAIPCQLYGVKPPTQKANTTPVPNNPQNINNKVKRDREVMDWSTDSTKGFRGVVGEGRWQDVFTTCCHGITESSKASGAGSGSSGGGSGGGRHLVELFRAEDCTDNIAHELIEKGLAEPILISN